MELKKEIKKCIYILSAKWRGLFFLLQNRDSKAKYYIIKPRNQEAGLFSYFNLFLPEILMAKKAGWIPVIDMQTIKTPYLESAEVGIKNAWEYYFLQPGGINLAQINSEELVNTGKMPFRNGPYSGRAFYEDWYGDKTFWREFVANEIKVKKEIQDKVLFWWNANFDEKDHVLGVLCRGTDYLRLKPTGHAKQPSAEQCVEKTQELMRAWNCNKVYLSTEDENILELFRKKFPNTIYFYDKKYVQDTGRGYITQIHFDRKEDARKQGEEYLIQILLLSKCHCLLAGPCGGAIGAELFTKGFIKEFVWDLGVYC